MQPVIIKTEEASATEALARGFASLLRAGDCVALVGELGVGKTTFSRGLVEGLNPGTGVRVHSPSFALLNEYPGSPPVYHLDLYRLGSLDELQDLGFADYLSGRRQPGPAGVTLIEWADRFGLRLPPQTYYIEINYDRPDGRVLRMRVDDAERAVRLKAWREKIRED